MHLSSSLPFSFPPPEDNIAASVPHPPHEKIREGESLYKEGRRGEGERERGREMHYLTSSPIQTCSKALGNLKQV